MSKYIIEIEEKPLCVFDKDTQTYFPRLWRVKGFNSLVFDEEGLNRLEELNSDYINEHYGSLQDEAYKRGINDGSLDVKQRVEGAYQRGLDDAWECGKKLAWTAKYGGYGERLNDVFGRDDTFDFYDYTPNEAIEKLKAFEQKQDKIEVGDEVINILTKTKGILLEPETEHLLATVIIPSQRWRTFNASHVNLKKTGKHYDIEKLLDAMKA